MIKKTPQNDNADARASARQAVTDLCAAWEAAQRPPVAVGQKLKTPEIYDRTNIILVVVFGDVPALEKLIAEGADVGVRQLLQTAAEHGHDEMVKVLLANHVDIHEDDDHALKRAVKGRHLETVRLLLNNGADIHAEGDYALRSSIDRGFFEIADLLLERGASMELATFIQINAYVQYSENEKSEKLREDLLRIEYQGKITAVFNAKTWAGHVNEMVTLWNKIPEPLQTGLDFPHMVAEAQHEYSRQNKPKKPVFIK
jgi:ankyrin repeat protein